MDSQREFLTQRYQKLWDGAIDRFRQGDVVIDQRLASGDADRRRSLTLLARPSAECRAAINRFLERLREIDPAQYYYDPSEFHVTVLSLFTATEDYARLLVRSEDYFAAVLAAMAGIPSFAIEFTGVTLSPEAIMVQGYPGDTTLNELRERLRQELRARNLTEGLDARYILQTAHITCVRIKSKLRDSGPYTETIEGFRTHPFGRTEVKELNLVRNDWYMSSAAVEILKRYLLAARSDSTA